MASNFTITVINAVQLILFYNKKEGDSVSQLDIGKRENNEKEKMYPRA